MTKYIRIFRLVLRCLLVARLSIWPVFQPAWPAGWRISTRPATRPVGRPDRCRSTRLVSISGVNTEVKRSISRWKKKQASAKLFQNSLFTALQTTQSLMLDQLQCIFEFNQYKTYQIHKIFWNLYWRKPKLVLSHSISFVTTSTLFWIVI